MLPALLRLLSGQSTPHPLLIAALALLAFLLNGLPVPLLFGIHFLLGSLVPVVVLLLWRTWWAVPIGATASLATLRLWGHPWAIVIFTLEMVVLAVFVKRFSGEPGNDLNGRIVFASIGYWLLVGIPLVLFFYGNVMGIDATNVVVTAAKQALNGVANTILAFLLFLLLRIFAARRSGPTVPLASVIFSLLIVAFIVPGILITLLYAQQLYGLSQAGVAENLRTIEDTIFERLALSGTALQPSGELGGMPPSVGSAAFRAVHRSGAVVSSNPGLFDRLERRYVDDGPLQIRTPGLKILVPKGENTLLKKWANGYWSVQGFSDGWLVEVVESSRPTVQLLQAQSASMVTTLCCLLLLGVVVSELICGRLRHLLLSIRTEPAEPGDVSLFTETSMMRQAFLHDRQQLYNLGQSLQESDRLLHEARQELDQFHRMDALTGVLSRKELFRFLSVKASHALAHGEGISCLAIAVDGLREVNERFGHTAGDAVLRSLAGDLNSAGGGQSNLFRLGGSVFALVLWNSGLISSRARAEQIRREIGHRPILWHDQELRVSISLGVATLLPGMESEEGLVSRAERALQEARRSGGNQVLVR